jgi:hypothetical protein
MPLLTAADLQKLCHDAFRQHPHSCSHAVWHVMNGALRPPLAPYHFRQANQLIDFLNNAPFWTAVTLQKAGVYANAGAVVIGGTKDDPNGHVIIVYPGPPKPAGGYHFTNRQGSLTFLPPRGLYPLAMSTSIGNWPGAKSDGDKTVWDPWGTDDAFADVAFWAQPADTGSIPTG